MSHAYIQRLRAIRSEYEAARQGIVFVSKNWHRHNVYQDISDATPADFKRAGEYMFATYIIRLSAEFDGVLKFHLNTNHPAIHIHKDAKIDWLISRVTKIEGFRVDKDLRRNMEKVRTYWNDFAHSGAMRTAVFTFDVALSWFNTFLARLPEPIH